MQDEAIKSQRAGPARVGAAAPIETSACARAALLHQEKLVWAVMLCAI